jgi:hypothetical protein
MDILIFRIPSIGLKRQGLPSGRPFSLGRQWNTDRLPEQTHQNREHEFEHHPALQNSASSPMRAKDFLDICGRPGQ